MNKKIQKILDCLFLGCKFNEYQNREADYWWVRKVINSCETDSQLMSAYRLIDLWYDKYEKLHDDNTKYQELRELWFEVSEYIQEI